MVFYFLAVRPWVKDVNRVACVELANKRRVDLTDVDSITGLMHRKTMPIRRIAFKCEAVGISSVHQQGLEHDDEPIIRPHETLGQTLERIKAGGETLDQFMQRKCKTSFDSRNRSKEYHKRLLQAKTGGTLLKNHPMQRKGSTEDAQSTKKKPAIGGRLFNIDRLSSLTSKKIADLKDRMQGENASKETRSSCSLEPQPGVDIEVDISGTFDTEDSELTESCCDLEGYDDLECYDLLDAPYLVSLGQGEDHRWTKPHDVLLEQAKCSWQVPSMGGPLQSSQCQDVPPSKPFRHDSFYSENIQVVGDVHPTTSGCMKVSRVQESLSNVKTQDSPPSLPQRSSSFSNFSLQAEESEVALFDDATFDAHQCLPKKTVSVHWGGIEIREYMQCLGDNPACSQGAPVQLDWHYRAWGSVPLGDFEANRGYRRDDLSLRTSSSQRQHLLLQLGYSSEDMDAAIRAKCRDQQRRIQTVQWLQYSLF